MPVFAGHAAARNRRCSRQPVPRLVAPVCETAHNPYTRAMQCLGCGRATSSPADGLCPPCALQSERTVNELVGETPVEHCEFDGKAMEIAGLPARTPLADTSTERKEPAVPGAILNAPDVERETMLRNAGGGA